MNKKKKEEMAEKLIASNKPKSKLSQLSQLANVAYSLAACATILEIGLNAMTTMMNDKHDKHDKQDKRVKKSVSVKRKIYNKLLGKCEHEWFRVYETRKKGRGFFKVPVHICFKCNQIKRPTRIK